MRVGRSSLHYFRRALFRPSADESLTFTSACGTNALRAAVCAARRATEIDLVSAARLCARAGLREAKLGDTNGPEITRIRTPTPRNAAWRVGGL